MSGFRFSNLRTVMTSRFTDHGDKQAEPANVVVNLRIASELVESTAFAAAGHQPTTVVSQLIMASAELERLAQIVERGVDTRT